MSNQTAAAGANVTASELLVLRSHALKLRHQRPRKTAAMAGQFVSASRGRGLEFVEVRHYHTGDDVRSIDWRISARSGKTHTRLYAEERERPVLILCDLRRTMQFGTRTRFKSVQAANLTALLAWTAINSGDRAGGIIFTDQQHLEVRPSLSAANVAKFLGLVAEHCQSTPQHSVNSTASMLAELRRVSRPGSKIYAISDFYDWDDDCAKQLALLSRHNDCHMVMISDALEQHLPKNGLFPFSDGEQDIVLHGGKDTAALAQRFEARVETLTACSQQYRTSFSHVRTSDDPISLINGLSR